ncbi:MAG: DUF3078 domain-containing protein [Chitinophagaceae bacterium]|nr:DUF3078 domain-containing protein [Chitinophagaceae bacterium]
MKKPLLFTPFIFFTVVYVSAQDPTIKDLKNEATKSIKKDPADTAAKTWKLGGLVNVNINQGTLTNWSAGGDQFSFSLNAFLNVFAFYKKNKSSWDNNLDLGYGIVNTTSLGSRKASDRIDLLSKYGYAISPKWNAAALFNLRTQFANGYAYSKTAAGADTAVIISKTFAPAFVLLSLGFDYKPNENFSLFLSPLTERWVIVTDDSIAPLFGVVPGKNSKNELGAFVSANYTKKLGANFVYKSKLDLFSNYKQKPQNIDIFWTNALTAKLTKYINFSFQLDMIYDDDTKNVKPTKGPAPQWLQLMGIGIAWNFSKK